MVVSASENWKTFGTSKVLIPEDLLDQQIPQVVSLFRECSNLLLQAVAETLDASPLETCVPVRHGIGPVDTARAQLQLFRRFVLTVGSAIDDCNSILELLNNGACSAPDEHDDHRTVVLDVKREVRPREHAALPGLPSEIWNTVLINLRPLDLESISRTSKYLNALSIPMLYGDVVLTPPRIVDELVLRRYRSRLFRTLTEADETAHAEEVRAIRMLPEVPLTSGEDSCGLPWSSTGLEGENREQFFAILPLLGQLKTVNVWVDRLTPILSLTHLETLHLFECDELVPLSRKETVCFPVLRNFSFDASRTLGSGTLAILIEIIQSPQLERLRMRCDLPQFLESWHSGWEPLSWDHLSNLTNLKLCFRSGTGSDIFQRHFLTFLFACPNLRSLDIAPAFRLIGDADELLRGHCKQLETISGPLWLIPALSAEDRSIRAWDILCHGLPPDEQTYPGVWLDLWSQSQKSLHKLHLEFTAEFIPEVCQDFLVGIASSIEEIAFTLWDDGETPMLLHRIGQMLPGAEKLRKFSLSLDAVYDGDDLSDTDPDEFALQTLLIVVNMFPRLETFIIKVQGRWMESMKTYWQLGFDKKWNANPFPREPTNPSVSCISADFGTGTVTLR